MPNYTYLKLKIPRLRGIITVGFTYQRAYECDAECFQSNEATIRSERLHAEPRSEDQDVPESLLTVNSCIKVRLDLQADKSPVVVKGPPRVVNPRYRIRETMCNARIQSSKAR
jgi:hypothetical protein